MQERLKSGLAYSMQDRFERYKNLFYAPDRAPLRGAGNGGQLSVALRRAIGWGEGVKAAYCR